MDSQQTKTKQSKQSSYWKWWVIAGVVFGLFLVVWSYLNYSCAISIGSSNKEPSWLLKLFYGDKCRINPASITANQDRNQQRLSLRGTTIELTNGGNVDLALVFGQPNLIGALGPQGEAGIAGTNGVAGIDGINGAIGSIGPPGAPGVPGPSDPCSNLTTYFCQNGNSFGNQAVFGTTDNNSILTIINNQQQFTTRQGGIDINPYAATTNPDGNWYTIRINDTANNFENGVYIYDEGTFQAGSFDTATGFQANFFTVLPNNGLGYQPGAYQSSYDGSAVQTYAWAAPDSYVIGNTRFDFNPTTFVGAQYAADYSANYVPLSLITYQDLLNGISNIPANNGLMNNSGTIQLGNAIGGISATLQNDREIPQNGFNVLFSGSGKLGIGTITPDVFSKVNIVDTNAPSQTLLVSSNTAGNLFAAQVALRNIGPMGQESRLQFYDGLDLIGGVYSQRVGAGLNSNLKFIVRNNTLNHEAMRIDSAGRIGIGTTTPLSILNIAGTGAGGTAGLQWQGVTSAPALATAGSGRIYFNSTSNQWQCSVNTGVYTNCIGALGGAITSINTIATGPNVDILPTANQTTVTTIANNVTLGIANNPIIPGTAPCSSSVGAITFANASTGALTTNTSNLCWNNTSNRLGIGTSSPWAKFEVVQQSNNNTASLTNYGNPNELTLRRAQGTLASPTIIGNGGVMGRLLGQGYDGSAFLDSAQIGFEVDGASGINNMPGRIVFATTPAGSTTVQERARFNNSGQLLINKTTASNSTNRLEVMGGGANSTEVARFNNGGAVNCTVVPGGTGFACSSDVRLKDNIESILSPEEIISGLRGVTFNWKGGTETHAGFVAQELEAILPSAVSVDEAGYKVANYQEIIPYLVEVVKSQDGKLVGINGKMVDFGVKVENLSDELKNLAGRINKLETNDTTQDVRIKLLEEELVKIKEAQHEALP